MPEDNGLISNDSPSPSGRGEWRTLLIIGVAAVVCALSASLFTSVESLPWIWPSAAVCAIAYFRYGLRALPVIIIATFTGVLALWRQETSHPLITALPLTVAISALLCAQPILLKRLYLLLQTNVAPPHSETRLWNLLASLFLSALAAGLPIALVVRGAMPGEVLLQTTLYLLYSIGMPILLTVPVYTQWRRRNELYTLAVARVWEVLVWIALLLMAGGLLIKNGGMALFLLLPLFVWSSLRFGRFGGVLAICLSGLAALLAYGYGDTGYGSLAHFNLFHSEVAVMTIFSLYLSALAADRARVEDAIEQLVQRRTRELEAINQELQDEVHIRKQAERSFRTSTRRYRAIIETAGSPIIVMDKNFRIVQWNGAASRLFGYHREDIYGKNYITCFVPKAFQDETAWKITKVLETGVPVENLESEMTAADGGSHVMLWNINRVVDVDEELTQAIIIGQDISTIRETQNQLHFLAHYDVLTGAANRRLFEDRCRQALKQASRRQHDVGLISLDIDHFKRINDTLGHDAGDALLQEICRRLASCVREEDTIARLGGDEFAILLNRVNGAEDCELVGRNLLEAITKPVELPGQQLVITTSIGVTVSPRDGVEYSVLLKNADMAMYRAKKAGRNNIQMYQKEMNDELTHQINTEQELRAAISGHQFDIYYQPQIDLENQHIVGLEALLRWRHPKRGVLAPHEFITVAEQTGLLPALGEWIFYNACLQCRAIQAMSRSHVQVAINISARQLHHPQMVDTLKRVIAEIRVNPAFLNLEIGEQVLVSNPAEAAEILGRLKEIGVNITIDSFGSGLSSLSNLARLPVDAVKIDRALTRNVPGDDYDAAILETLLSIASRMHMRVIVEGIERTEQETFFRNHNVRYVQGHLYSLPMPSDQLPEFFNALKQGVLNPEGGQIGLPLN
ncbi:EAL domain-containing protein [Hahella sp. CR1]|uniref:bifunctional diguanylate cyclase/phosphodiesterase n=1 Tax=Hahella sp. CR1 TaxID=2992807 RepID=UPI0024415098|nr:EAL domain-containing protein [Hahella sp. CR1]MDG9671741.1 EAL domain-containing protein [Hahella sp. CR1]